MGETWRQRLVNFAIPALLALILIASGNNSCGDSVVYSGIARELITGSTEGRQALVGSFWYGPLPAMGFLPFAWIFGVGTLSTNIAAWFYWSLTLFMGGRATVNHIARLLMQGMLAAAILLTRCVTDHTMAFIAVILVFSLRSLMGWCTNQSVKDLVGLSFGTALLAGCGMPLAGIVAILAFSIPLTAVFNAATRRRLFAILILGWLPLLYSLSVWVLSNWLIFSDPWFFMRPLTGMHAIKWHFTGSINHGEIIGILIIAFAFITALKQKRISALATVVIALLSWTWLHLLSDSGIEWSTAPALAVFIFCVMALWQARCGVGQNGKPIWSAYGDLLLVLLVALVVNRSEIKSAQLESNQAMHAVLRKEIQTFVKGRTPYGRIFVCGYNGLVLFDRQGAKECDGECDSSDDSDMLLPNFDLHISDLRKRYFGQQIFLLVHAPLGPARFDNVHSRFPWLYEAGAERAMYAADFGAWRLFQVIGAPTEEQLQEWRKLNW